MIIYINSLIISIFFASARKPVSIFLSSTLKSAFMICIYNDICENFSSKS